MQSSRNPVRLLLEFSSGVEFGKHDLDRRLVLRLMEFYGYASSVVNNGNRAVGVDIDVYVFTETRERLVNRVVDDLVNEVVEPGGSGRAYVHGGPFSYGFETSQNLYGIFVVRRIFFYVDSGGFFRGFFCVVLFHRFRLPPRF